jgi:hypothetical protein
MQSPADDDISRADLALVLKTAAEIQVESEDVALSLAEAERIAAEVGIQPADFRAALASHTPARPGKGRVFGPQGVLSAEGFIGRRVSPDHAAHMLAQAQLKLSTGGRIEAPADGLWRLSDKGSVLQVATLGNTTTISAASDRRRMKAGLIGGGAIVGVFGGVTAASAAAIAIWGSVEAMALAQIIGTSGGAVVGLAAGVASWRAAAKRTQERVFAALERMRKIADPGSGGETDRLDPSDRVIG